MSPRATVRLILCVAFAVLALGLAFWFDTAAVDLLRAGQTRAIRSFMRSVSWWGDWPTHVIGGAVAAGIAHLLGSRRWFRIFLAMIVACAIAGAATRVVKIGTGRARPSVQVDSGWNGPRLSSKYHAFPSGHTASSSAFFAVLAVASWRAGAVFLPVVLLIAFSRMYVGAHHLSDVVAAIILGGTVGFLVTRWRIFEITNRKSEVEN